MHFVRAVDVYLKESEVFRSSRKERHIVIDVHNSDEHFHGVRQPSLVTHLHREGNSGTRSILKARVLQKNDGFSVSVKH